MNFGQNSEVMGPHSCANFAYNLVHLHAFLKSLIFRD